MTPPVPARPAEPSARPAEPSVAADEWPAQAADGIVRLVDSVKHKTTVPAHTAAKALKYGPAVVTFASFLAVVLLVGTLRLFERALIRIGEAFDPPVLAQPMWIVYLFFGLVFSAVGWRLWSKASL